MGVKIYKIRLFNAIIKKISKEFPNEPNPTSKINF